MSQIVRTLGRFSTRRRTPIVSDIVSDPVISKLKDFNKVVEASVPRATMEVRRTKPEVIGTLTEFKRTVTVHNRRKRNGVERETVLTILNHKTPVLMLTRNEVEELEKALPKIKAHLRDFAKQI